MFSGIKHYKKIIINILLKQLMLLLRIFPIKNNKIVFSNFLGKGYGDSPKYICEALLKKGTIDAVWLIKDTLKYDDLPNGVRTVKYRSLRKFFELATAKVWVDNCRKGEYYVKRKSQYYVMTWHAGVCLKKVEKDAIDSLGKDYADYAMSDSKQIDLMVSNSKWCTELYRTSFWYNGDIIEKGLPRNDILLSATKNSKLKRCLGISDSDNVLLYVPTFRNGYSTSSYNLDIDLVLNAAEKKFDGNWVFLARMHPSVNYRTTFSSRKYTVKDVSNVGDLYELLTITDVVISDYSSVVFDFAITRKPVFLFATDINEYNNDRGIYFDIRKLPFLFADNNKELVDNIFKFDNKRYLELLEMFFDDLGLNETGKSSEYISQMIAQHLS